MSEELISAVKLNNILYDLSHPEYRDIRKKNKIWDQIGITLKQNGEDLKSKWKNLRDNYAKHLRSQKTHTGQAAVYHYKSWPWAQQMEFLKPYLRHSNVRNDDESETTFENRDQLSLDDENTLSNTQQSMETKPSTSTEEGFFQPEEYVSNKISSSFSRKRKRTGTKRSQPSPVEKVLAYFEKNNSKLTDCYDDIDLICLGYAKTIKKFSPRRQVITKFKLARILMQEELNHHLEENSTVPETKAAT